MAYDIRVRLVIWNEVPGILDFAQIEESLGLGSPAETWRIGDGFGYKLMQKRSMDGVLYRFFEGRNCDPIREAERLLERLDRAPVGAGGGFGTGSGELSIVIRLYPGGDDTPMDVPPFHLSPRFIERLHYYQLELDVDLYMLPGDGT